MEIRLAENGDLSGWVQLVEPMRHLFPGLETPESMEGYARDIAGAISRQEALCAVENGTICGVLAFSRADKGQQPHCHCAVLVFQEVRGQLTIIHR